MYVSSGLCLSFDSPPSKIIACLTVSLCTSAACATCSSSSMCTRRPNDLVSIFDGASHETKQLGKPARCIVTNQNQKPGHCLHFTSHELFSSQRTCGYLRASYWNFFCGDPWRNLPLLLPCCWKFIRFPTNRTSPEWKCWPSHLDAVVDAPVFSLSLADVIKAVMSNQASRYLLNTVISAGDNSTDLYDCSAPPSLKIFSHCLPPDKKLAGKNVSCSGEMGKILSQPQIFWYFKLLYRSCVHTNKQFQDIRNIHIVLQSLLDDLAQHVHKYMLLWENKRTSGKLATEFLFFHQIIHQITRASISV